MLFLIRSFGYSLGVGLLLSWYLRLSVFDGAMVVAGLLGLFIILEVLLEKLLEYLL